MVHQWKMWNGDNLLASKIPVQNKQQGSEKRWKVLRT